MAKGTTFYVRDPQGRKHTRTSLNRTYTHTVLVRDSYENAIQRCSETGWTRLDTLNFNYYTALVNGTHPSLKSWYDHETEETFKARCAEYVAKAVKALDGCTDLATYLAREHARRIASVEEGKLQGKYDDWGPAGWCGRFDLAQKLAQKERSSGYRAEVLIVPVEVK